jgi:hypothetical protein
MSQSRFRSPFVRLGRLLAAFAGAGLVAAAPVAAQTVTPEQAPAEWVRYATGATIAVTGWLQADSEAAGRLRAYLDATRPAPDQPTAPLVIKLWIDADGTVSRIEHPPFAHAEANADLSALVVGRRLPTAPPRDMLLPLRIAVQLDAPAPAAEPAAGAPSPCRDPRKLI